MEEVVKYEGRDLEAMAFAVNYHQWILQLFRPHLGCHAVEVGAGSGSFSEMLMECGLASLALVEPAANGYAALCQRMAQPLASTSVTTYNSVFRLAAAQIKAVQPPDSIIYVNVLEHIADDCAELKIIRETLSDDGKLFIFVPAMPWLYSRYDKKIGHFRRYAKHELEEKCVQAGFQICQSFYFDLLGIAPWFIKYRLLKAMEMEPSAVAVYDRYVVPVAKKLETLWPPPRGKNLVLIAAK